MKHFFKLGLLACIFLISCKTTPYEVLHVSQTPDAPIESNGSFYTLPRQSLKISLITKKTEYLAGPCAEHAERLLNLKDVIKEDYTTYELVGVRFATQTEADPAQIYFVSHNDDNVKISYSQNMIIKSAKVKTPKKFKLFRKEPKQNDSKKGKDQRSCDFKDKTEAYEGSWDEFNTKLTPNKRATLMEAMEIVQLINKTKEDRQKLMTSYYEINYDGNAIKYLHEDFNKTEDDCLKLFKGLQRTSYECVDFFITPENAEETDYIIAYFSEDKGVQTELNVEESINEGESSPVFIKFEVTDYAPYVQNFNQHIQQDKQGFFFRLPVNTKVSAILNGKSLYSKELNFSQFGAVQNLPVMNGRFLFSPCSGELVGVE